MDCSTRGIYVGKIRAKVKKVWFERSVLGAQIRRERCNDK